MTFSYCFPTAYATPIFSHLTLSFIEKNGTAEIPGKALWVAAWYWSRSRNTLCCRSSISPLEHHDNRKPVKITSFKSNCAKPKDTMMMENHLKAIHSKAIVLNLKTHILPKGILCLHLYRIVQTINI